MVVAIAGVSPLGALRYGMRGVRGLVFDGGARHDPARPRARRELRLSAPEHHQLMTADGVRLRLTRYRGGSRGPVVLGHCIGVSSTMFTTDTIETNLAEYLYERGYDVWLPELRLSIELPAAGRTSTFDDVALRDWPLVIETVRKVTEAHDVQVVAHGIGSQTFAMAMLSGMPGVRAAVCSQVAAHLEVRPLNRFKTEARVSSILRRMGARTVTAYTDSDASWFERLYDRTLWLYPVQAEEHCNDLVCHRVTSLYGELYEHDRLAPATHDALHELFGVVNLRAFSQLSRIIRTGHLVDAEGGESYLPNLDRLALPMLFVHGEENECVLPAATERTMQALSEANGGDHYKRFLVPGYGHVDCIIGEHASRDVYPAIADFLDRTND